MQNAQQILDSIEEFDEKRREEGMQTIQRLNNKSKTKKRSKTKVVKKNAANQRKRSRRKN